MFDGAQKQPSNKIYNWSIINVAPFLWTGLLLPIRFLLFFVSHFQSNSHEILFSFPELCPNVGQDQTIW